MLYRLVAKIPGLQQRGIGYSFDPTIVIDALIEAFGTDLTVCLHDLAWRDHDNFVRDERAIVSGAIRIAENDARRRGPIWAFRIRTETDQIVRGRAERYVIDLASDRPIPQAIQDRFAFALRELLRFEPFRLYRFDGENDGRSPITRGEQSWAAVDLLPRQGDWSEADFLRLDVNRHVELVGGRIEVPPHPTDRHQEVGGTLLVLLRRSLADSGLGIVRHAPFPVRLRERTFRMPDLCFILREHSERRGERFWNGADLVVEVTSEESHSRDRHEKRRDYAVAGIPEYWIADPRESTLTIFTLDAGATEYREAGRYKEGETAASVLLDGLTVEVAKVFAAE